MSIRPQIEDPQGVADKKAAAILSSMKSVIDTVTGRAAGQSQIKTIGTGANLYGVIDKVNEIIAQLQSTQKPRPVSPVASGKETLTVDLESFNNWTTSGHTGTPDTVPIFDSAGAAALAEKTGTNKVVFDTNPSLPGYLDFVAIANPSSPAAGIARFHSATTQGFTRFEQDNEAATNLVLSRDTVFLARNTSGSTITKGQCVEVTGSTGNVPNIGLARANSLTTLPSVGMALDDIANNAFGQVMYTGIITQIDTSAFAAGDTLWVSSSVAGAHQNTRPTNPDYVQLLGTVLVSGVGNGSILVVTAPFIGNMETGTTAVTFTAAAYVGTTFNKYTLTTPATGVTLTIADGKTLTASNTLTLTATDGSTLAIGSGGTLGTAAYTASTDYAPAAGSSSIVTTGALNAGSITNGFGSIDIGADALTAGASTLGAVTSTGLSSFGRMSITAQNLVHGTSLMRLSQESANVSQIRLYGENGTTQGSLEIITSASDGAPSATAATISSASLVAVGTIKPGGYTVATLPTGVTGAKAYVTDASGPAYLTALTGGGAAYSGAEYTGAAWVSA